MVRLILAVVALLVLVGYQDVGGQKATQIEKLKKNAELLDKTDIGVPYGTSKDEACKAFWRLSAYQMLLDEYGRLKVKDLMFKKMLGEKVRAIKQKAALLLHEKADSGQVLGCGGREIPDTYILEMVGPSPLKPEKPAPGITRR